MARLNVSGLDGVMSELSRLGAGAEAKISAMLEAGGAEVEEAWRQAIQSAGLVKTGDMLAAVKAGDLKRDESGGSVVIYPRGRDRYGQSNATKAFVNHYGSSRTPATGFVDKAEENGEQRAVQAMEQIWAANG